MNDWRLEKSRNMIAQVCFILKHTRSIKTDVQVATDDLRNHFLGIFHDATKLYCDSVDARPSTEDAPQHGDRWSPDLPRYLFDHPEECDSTLEIVAGEDYRDNYYDDCSSTGTGLE